MLRKLFSFLSGRNEPQDNALPVQDIKQQFMRGLLLDTKQQIATKTERVEAMTIVYSRATEELTAHKTLSLRDASAFLQAVEIMNHEFERFIDFEGSDGLVHGTHQLMFEAKTHGEDPQAIRQAIRQEVKPLARELDAAADKFTATQKRMLSCIIERVPESDLDSLADQLRNYVEGEYGGQRNYNTAQEFFTTVNEIIQNRKNATHDHNATPLV